jgi:hypothetical protein
MSASAAFSADRLFNLETRITKAVMPIYPDTGVQPLAIIRVDKIFVDHQRRGFFRIGVLPMLAMEGLSIELCDTNQLIVALTNVQSCLSFKGGSSSVVEGRDFSLLCPGGKSEFIHARLARLENKEWKLVNGTLSRPGTNSIQFQEAVLGITGKEAGNVICRTDQGRVRVQLLSVPTPNLTNHHENPADLLSRVFNCVDDHPGPNR